MLLNMASAMGRLVLAGREFTRLAGEQCEMRHLDII